MASDTIIRLFAAAAESCRDNIAFNYFGPSWKEVTYDELLRATKGIASHLIQTGVNPGERIAIVSENRWEWCASYLAIQMAGAIAVPVDAQLGKDEIRNLLDDSEAALVFHSAKTEENVGGGARRTVNFDSSLFAGICNGPEIENYREPSEDDIASILYTSGTTGKPKGVVLTHRNFCSDAKAVIEAGIVTREDNVLAILPLHHTYPFMCTFLVPVFLGATVTFPPSLKGPELISTVKERKVTILVAVPQLLELMRNGMVRKLNEMPGPLPFLLRLFLKGSGSLRRKTGVNAGRLAFGAAHKAFGDRFRFFASGGARLDPKVMEDLEALGFTVLEGYGLTETSPVVTFNPLEKRKPGSAGRPLPSVEIRILNPAESGEGEIAIRGPMVMKGYYRNPEETARVLRDDWFFTGDLGYLDDEGYLFITGRAKEVIVLGSGKNVYPEDVEREYLKIPLIKELCVMSIEERGVVESLHAIIVPDMDFVRKGRIGNIHEALKSAINEVSLKLPPYMRIKGFTLYPEPLPKTPLGKLKRFMIKDLLDRTKGAKREAKEEDRQLLGDDIGRTVAECITSLMKEKMPVRSEDSLELDLGLDSLQRVELVVALERAFSLKLPETFASEVQTVEDLVVRIKEFGLKGGPVGAEVGPRWKDLFTFEPSEEEKKKIGLDQGKIAQAVGLFFLRLLRRRARSRFRLEARGLENLPTSPFIIAPNHCSNMDGFVIAVAVPDEVFRVLYFQGFQKYFTGQLTSLFARLAHVIPIDPETFLTRALQLSSYVLRRKRSLCIFPEGARSLDGELLEFRKGIGILAIEHDIPVVPTLIEGTFEALPRGAVLPKRTKIKVAFGKPLYPSEVDHSRKPEGIDEHQFFTNEMRERVKGLRSM